MKKNIFLTLLFFLVFNSLNAQTPVLEIFEIQGAGSSSPYENQLVIANQNVVTAVGDGFFFMQTPGYRSDNQQGTSDGIMVLSNNIPTVQVGNLVSVSGYVDEVNDRTQFNSGSLMVTIDSGSVSLPSPCYIDRKFPIRKFRLTIFPDLEKLEGMYVQINQATTTAPTNEYGETSIKVGSNEEFSRTWNRVSRSTRDFRFGMAIRKFLYSILMG